jgi:hypothetical protein
LSNMSEIRTPMNANYSLKVVLKQIWLRKKNLVNAIKWAVMYCIDKWHFRE